MRMRSFLLLLSDSFSLSRVRLPRWRRCSNRGFGSGRTFRNIGRRNFFQKNARPPLTDGTSFCYTIQPITGQVSTVGSAAHS